MFVSFDKEFRQVSENIAFHSTRIDWVANAANIEEAKRATTRQGQVRASIQKWLSPVSVQDDLLRHEENISDGSYDWILTSSRV